MCLGMFLPVTCSCDVHYLHEIAQNVLHTKHYWEKRLHMEHKKRSPSLSLGGSR